MLTLIERQTLLDHEVKRKQIQVATSSAQPILEQLEKVEEKLPHIHSEKTKEEIEKAFEDQWTLIKELWESRIAEEEASNIQEVDQLENNEECMRDKGNKKEEEERMREKMNPREEKMK